MIDDNQVRVTPTQRETLLLIAAHRQFYGMPPTFRELARSAGVTVNAIACRVRQLRALGLVAP